MKRKGVVVLGALIVVVCVAVPVAYLLLLPVPLLVRGQIEKDLPDRTAITIIYGPHNQGVLEQIFSRDRKPYTYEIVEVIQKNSTDGTASLPISDSATKVLCISIRVTYPINGVPIFGSRSNPEIFNYLAQKENGEWSTEFFDRRSSTCR